MIKVGDTDKSNNFGDYTVIEYIKSTDITIMFNNTGHVIKTKSPRIRTGNIKDVMMPCIYGVGFFGAGSYRASQPKTKDGGKRKNTKHYNAWKAMLMRCYCPAYQEWKPTYKGCSVCDEWFNFQNFAKWFDDNYSEGLQVDKDIKINGNKIYSPETCIFVSASDNSLKAFEPIMKEVTLYHDDGRVEVIYNQNEFCRENNLQQGNLSRMINGNRKHHKGWRLHNDL